MPARLLIQDEGGERTLELGEGLTRIGRAHEAELCLTEPKCSRAHCEIRRAGDRLVLKDLGSRNGTRLNGQAVTGEHPLYHQDDLRIGQTRITLDAPEAPRPAAPVSPSPAGPALIAELGPLAGQRWELKASPVTIGRRSDNVIVLHEPRVSARHARLERIGGGWIILDCNSTNGVRVNGEKQARAALHDGDRIAIEETVLRYAAGVEAPAPVPAPLPAAAPGPEAHVDDGWQGVAIDLSGALDDGGGGRGTAALAIGMLVLGLLLSLWLVRAGRLPRPVRAPDTGLIAGGHFNDGALAVVARAGSPAERVAQLPDAQGRPGGAYLSLSAPGSWTLPEIPCEGDRCYRVEVRHWGTGARLGLSVLWRAGQTVLAHDRLPPAVSGAERAWLAGLLCAPARTGSFAVVLHHLGGAGLIAVDDVALFPMPPPNAALPGLEIGKLAARRLSPAGLGIQLDDAVMIERLLPWGAWIAAVHPAAPRGSVRYSLSSGAGPDATVHEALTQGDGALRLSWLAPRPVGLALFPGSPVERVLRVQGDRPGPPVGLEPAQAQGLLLERRLAAPLTVLFGRSLMVRIVPEEGILIDPPEGGEALSLSLHADRPLLRHALDAGWRELEDWAGQGRLGAAAARLREELPALREAFPAELPRWEARLATILAQARDDREEFGQLVLLSASLGLQGLQQATESAGAALQARLEGLEAGRPAPSPLPAPSAAAARQRQADEQARALLEAAEAAYHAGRLDLMAFHCRRILRLAEGSDPPPLAVDHPAVWQARARMQQAATDQKERGR